MNLLIVDDDNISTFVSTRLAEKTGVFKEIRTAHNGKDALEILAGVGNGLIPAPDLVLLDLDMPLMGGFGFIEALNASNYPNKDRLNIVILTSSDNVPDIERAKALGIRHYLRKSLALQDLQNTIFSLFSSWQSLVNEENNFEMGTDQPEPACK